MAEEAESYTDPYGVDNALDTAPPTYEPILTQIDVQADQRLTNPIYQFELLRNTATDEIMKLKTGVKYQDLEMLAGKYLSHINMVVNITWEDSRVMYLDCLMECDSLMRTKYKRDPIARVIVNNFIQVYQRSLIAAVDGSHQKYNTQMQGSYRTAEVIQPKPVGSRGLFNR